MVTNLGRDARRVTQEELSYIDKLFAKPEETQKAVPDSDPSACFDSFFGVLARRPLNVARSARPDTPLAAVKKALSEPASERNPVPLRAIQESASDKNRIFDNCFPKVARSVVRVV